MRQRPETHYFTGVGALCGASGASSWSLVKSLATCPRCRELLDEERREATARKGRAPLALGRTRGG